MEYRPYSAQTTKDLRILAERHGAGTILELTPEELRRSASRWTHRHLIAYRLLTQPEQATLPILALTHDQCPQCNERSPVQSINRIWTGHLTGDTPKRLTARTESELAALPGGFFWIALARAARREPPGEGHVYPERDRKPVDRQEYVNSTRVIDGSSSPPAPPSSSGFEVSFSDIDEDEHHVRRNQPEEVTVCLATSFLQYALSLCLLQAPEATTELRVRVERMTAVAQIAGAVHLVAEDDGGICSMHRVKEGWSMEHPWLALLEAKRAFKHVGFNSGSGEYTPIVTNENLAQYLGEAVITWKANRENDNKNIQDDVFLIAAVNTFISFVYFKFNSDYMEYLDTNDEVSQRAIIDDVNKDAVVYMRKTKWYNLEKPQARYNALCHVLALGRFHDGQGEPHAAAGSSGASEFEGDGSAMDTDDEH